MSRKEWLEYHDKIVANELAALKKSPERKDFLVRMLQLMKYKQINNVSDLQKVQDTQLGLFTFENENKERVPIKSLVVINKTQNNFKVYPGSHSVTEFYLFVRQSDDYSVVAFLRNGNVAVAKHIDFTHISFLQNHENLIHLKEMEKELTDNRMVLKKAGL